MTVCRSEQLEKCQADSSAIPNDADISYPKAPNGAAVEPPARRRTCSPERWTVPTTGYADASGAKRPYN